MRVMRWDACISMVVFTVATVAFYILGAAVLHRDGLDPEKNQMIRALSRPYEQVFGPWAWWLFLFGAFAVLYSTFFVANASHARVVADALRVLGITAKTERARLRSVQVLCALLPAICLVFFVFIRAPARLVLASGVMQAMMLPMLAAATLYFRYRRCDPRIAPGRFWDLMLWISSFGMLVAGGWVALTWLFPGLETLGLR
jgi:Mn2+/Fe2+ NRAMP family transporter